MGKSIIQCVKCGRNFLIAKKDEDSPEKVCYECGDRENKLYFIKREIIKITEWRAMT